MNLLGQIFLLVAFVGSGYAAFASLAGWRYGHRAAIASGVLAAAVAAVALTAASIVLGYALVARDFGFEYVARYTSRLLPWHYSLSAFWVGQSGSLLLWAWLLSLLALAYCSAARGSEPDLRACAFGILMTCLCFLAAILVFVDDPMRPGVSAVRDGDGLSPLLLHPAMLLHPPIVFLGYAVCSIPCALAVAAAVLGRRDDRWIREARPWALAAWAVLGLGILLGAEWAYEELGWGGYWGWDPVENGSLIPWLTATALVHCMLGWQHRGVLKRSSVLLAIATFGLCNFATFVTRSDVFSSLHAFGQSPIGWMFLALMIVLAAGGVFLVGWRWASLAPDRPMQSLRSREAVLVISTMALVLLATVVLVGTLSIPISELSFGPRIVVGAGFYRNVFVPIGLLLLVTTAMAPLLRWGSPPARLQARLLFLSLASGGAAAGLAFVSGVRHPIALAVAGLSTSALGALAASVVLDARRPTTDRTALGLLRVLALSRRKYAGFLIHLSVYSLAVGVTGSSLATRQHEVILREGETVPWAERSVRLVRFSQRETPGKFVAEAQLEITGERAAPFTLFPAQHLHLPSREWTTEVAIHSTWAGDFYTILHHPEDAGRVRLTLIENPLMRWLWAAGWIGGAGVVLGLWPARRRRSQPSVPAAEARRSLPRHGRRDHLVPRSV